MSWLKEIKEFSSLSEYERFTDYLAGRLSEDELEEIEPKEYYHGKSPLELTKKELGDYVRLLEKQMRQAAEDLQFERAAQLRDKVFEYKVKL